MRHTDGETLATLRSVALTPVVSTAGLFRESQDFYFAFDGRLNPHGSRRIAEFLVKLDGPAAKQHQLSRPCTRHRHFNGVDTTGVSWPDLPRAGGDAASAGRHVALVRR